ncbi:MAG: hypothetical protein D6725_18310 [Planctomycetota bacterium]|nr:MAG: hypothetical protein D6725_18310 [Planctomycetota bacterium]
MLSALLITAASVSGGACGDVRVPVERPRRVRNPLFGERLQQKLETIASVSWENLTEGGRSFSLRAVRRTIEDVWRIPLLVDRRIDPNSEISVAATDVSIREVLRKVADQAGGVVCFDPHFVYVGPESAVHRLRTLIALRAQELYELQRRREENPPPLDPRRYFELVRREDLVYSDLDSPRQILQRIGERYDVAFVNLQAVPHDLWAGCELPQLTFVEAVSVVLIQYDATFRWEVPGRSLRIVSAPEHVAVARTYRVPPAKRAAFSAAARALGLDVPAGRSRVVLAATIEQHERLKGVLSGTADRPDAVPVPLQRRRFTLELRNAPVLGVMKQLEQAGIRFDYSPQELATAGIDLQQRVSLKLTDAPPETFFRALFQPLGLKTSIDGQIVRLRPARSSDVPAPMR